ncbi:MAG: cobalamin biosynthesis protein [Desulfurivibrio sp.]|nr:cobalamin biosynthesis protein [Desulfurivibrio sp.]
MKIGILAITAGGRELAARLAAGLAAEEETRPLAAEVVPVAASGPAGGTASGIAAALQTAWGRYDGLVCIMATGIVVRSLAPLLVAKERDPAVVVVDERGWHAISLLSGHLGGGNELARRVARFSGGRAVITTASEVRELTPLDLWAAAQHLVATDKRTMTAASARLVNQGRLKVYSETAVAELPAGLEQVEQAAAAELIISCRTDWLSKKFIFHPRQLVVGIGCNRGTPAAELAAALDELLAEQRLAHKAIRNLATIDLKRDEPGLLALAEQHGWPLTFYAAGQLNQGIMATQLPAADCLLAANEQSAGREKGEIGRPKANYSPFSAAVHRATGAGGVAEPAALLSSGAAQLLIRKRKWQNVTLALALADFTLSARVRALPNT